MKYIKLEDTVGELRAYFEDKGYSGVGYAEEDEQVLVYELNNED